MNRLLMLFLLLNLTSNAVAQKMPGIAVGESAPPFQAQDQRGKQHTLSSLMGPKGLVLLFFRSADW
jgi:hypothetical protein